MPVSHPVTGALLAAGSAVLYNSGFVLEKKALGELRSIHASRPVHLVGSLVGSPAWLVGFVVLLGGLAVQIAALSMAPISLVQPIFASGLLLLLVLSHIHLGERLSRPELYAVALVVAAVACLGASLGHGGDIAGSRDDLGGLILLAVPTLAVAGWCFVLAGRAQPIGAGVRRTERLPTALYGLAAGFAYGVASVATKAVAAIIERQGVVGALPHLLASPALYLLGMTSLAGLVAFQVGLQRSPASILVPVSNVTSSTYAVIVGSVLFGEQLPTAGWQAALRVVGLVGVLAGVALLAVRQPATL
ncbi:MAG: hypothetical protein M3R71_04145 [Actinomycetota bacterium]|nr:hypothetical protein [Actinomycetota bacterium]